MIKYLVILMISFQVIAQDRLSSKEFLKAYDKGKVNFEIFPFTRNLALGYLMSINKNPDPSKYPNALLIEAEKALLKDYEARYKFFNKEMLNVRYLDYGEYRYYISFDFYSDRKCKLRVEKIDFDCGNPVCDTKKFESYEELSKHPNADPNGTVIDDKYCEKIYNIKIN